MAINWYTNHKSIEVNALSTKEIVELEKAKWAALNAYETACAKARGQWLLNRLNSMQELVCSPEEGSTQAVFGDEIIICKSMLADNYITIRCVHYPVLNIELYDNGYLEIKTDDTTYHFNIDNWNKWMYQEDVLSATNRERR